MIDATLTDIPISKIYHAHPWKLRKNFINLNEWTIIRLARRRRFGRLRKLLQAKLHSKTSLLGCEHAEIYSKIDQWYEQNSERTSITSSIDCESISLCTIFGAYEKSKQANRIMIEVLKYRPPFAVVDLLCKMLKVDMNDLSSSMTNNNSSENVLYVEDSSDFHGRTPLHYAVLYGCECDVISRLLCGNEFLPRPALSVDMLGRTPLHLACISRSLSNSKCCLWTKGLRLCNRGHSDSVMDVVTLLAKSDPSAAKIKDFEGNTPIHLSLRFHADSKTIKLLSKIPNMLGS